MKTEGEIRQKIKQAQFRHIKRILRDSMPEGEIWSRHEVEMIKNHYKSFFSSAPVHVIAKDFPDVAALMWVLGDQPNCCLMVGGSLVGSLGGVILWADSDPEGESARSIIESLISSLRPSPPEDTGDPGIPEIPDPPPSQEVFDLEPCVSDGAPDGAPPEPPPDLKFSTEIQVSDLGYSDEKLGWFTKVWKRVFN